MGHSSLPTWYGAAAGAADAAACVLGGTALAWHHSVLTPQGSESSEASKALWESLEDAALAEDDSASVSWLGLGLG